jgi:RNA polymerase sigma factor (sigma-70 family)
MWFYGVYFSFVGLILLVLVFRIITLLLFPRKESRSFLLDLEETQDLLALVENCRDELGKARKAIHRTISRWEWNPRGVPSGDDRYRDSVDTAHKVFAEHGSFIRAVVGSRVKNEAQADDIFQNFFLSLVHKPVPEDIRGIKSYLYKAIINDIVDAACRVEQYQALVHRYSEQLNFSANTIRSEEALSMREETDKVLGLISSQLRRSEFQAITLRYGNCTDINEVAKKMGVNSGAVRRYMPVGLTRFRKFLTAK